MNDDLIWAPPHFPFFLIFWPYFFYFLLTFSLFTQQHNFFISFSFLLFKKLAEKRKIHLKNIRKILGKNHANDDIWLTQFWSRSLDPACIANELFFFYLLLFCCVCKLNTKLCKKALHSRWKNKIHFAMKLTRSAHSRIIKSKLN